MRSGILPRCIPYLSLFAMILSGCGKPSDLPSTSPVILGDLGITTQCPAGYLGAPQVIPLQIQDCATGVYPIELGESLSPFIFGVDCARKVITIRTLDQKLDSTWEMMPDNSFWISLTTLTWSLREGGKNRPNCNTPMDTQIWGNANCEGVQDQAELRFEMSFTAKTSLPGSCTLPKNTCTFRTAGKIKQCG